MNEELMSPENSRTIRNLLMNGYGLESKEAVKAFIQSIVGCVAESLANHSNFNGSEDGLLTAFKALVFGRKKTAKETFARRKSSNKGLSENERVAKKLLQLVLVQDIPDEESFVYMINKAVSEKEGIEEFDIYTFLQQHMDKDPSELAGLSLEKMSDNSVAEEDDPLQLPRSLQPGTQIALTFQGLVVVAEENDVQPGGLLGIQSKLREDVAELTGLDTQQVTQAAGALAKQNLLRRKSKGQSYKLFWRPDRVSEKAKQETEETEEDQAAEGGEGSSSQEKEPEPSEGKHDGQLRLSKDEKVQRLLDAFRVVRAEYDYTRTKQIGGEVFAYIGRQDKVMDDVEELGGFSEHQRTSAIRLARGRGLIHEEGSPYSGQASYYLRRDQLAEEADEMQQSDQGVSDEQAEAAEGAEDSDSALNESLSGSLESLLRQAEKLLDEDIPGTPRPKHKGRLGDRLEQINSLRDELRVVMEKLQELDDRLSSSQELTQLAVEMANKE